MTVSLLASLMVAPQPGRTGDAGDVDASVLGEAESEVSFEDVLADSGGFEADMPQPELPTPDGELLVELVPNLVLAQAQANETLPGDSALDTLRGTTGDIEKDFSNLVNVPLEPEQSAELAATIEQFLQRPDAGVVLTAAQRNVLFSLAARLKQAAVTETAQPIKAALAVMDTQLPANGGKAQERSALMGQLMKWVGQVLRNAQPQAAPLQPAITLKEDAPGKGAALATAPFPLSSVDEAPQEDAEDLSEIAAEAGAYPAVYVPQLPPVALAEMTESPIEVAVPAVELPEVSLPGEDVVPIGEVEEEAQGDGDQELLHALMQAAARAKQAARHASGGAEVSMSANAEASFALPTPFTPTTPEASVAQVANLAPAAGSAAPIAADPFLEGLNATPLAEIEGIPIASVTQPVSQQIDSTQATNAPPPTAHTPHTTRSDLLEQVHVGIKQAAFEGVDRITIQLQPMELGRVDVQIEVGHEGRAHISFAVDKPETLDQLQRDARILERALQEAGVKADAGSMEFNLRQGHGQAALQGEHGFGQQHQHAQADDNEIAAIGRSSDVSSETGTAIAYSLTIDQGLDIRV